MTLSAPATSARELSRRTPIVPNAVVGMLIFVVTEVMFFAGLISAHTIAKSNLPMGWPPPGQPRLPLESTALNTLALLASGALVSWAGQQFRKDPALARRPLSLGLSLGAFFVVAQGMEWIGLIREGLTLTSSTHGSFFYLIVGAHALHALCAILFLLVVLARLLRSELEASTFASARVLWLFVVCVWPVLYWKVYL
jgi:heme/copper-type cytochrome/quinol oxidase subunit 3